MDKTRSYVCGVNVRRSARLAEQRQPVEALGGVADSVAKPCTRAVARTSAASQLTPGHAPTSSTGSIRAQCEVLGLRAVRVGRNRTDRLAEGEAGPSDRPEMGREEDRAANANEPLVPPNINIDPRRSMGIRIVQLNARRSEVVTGEIRELICRKRLDILLLQEPYVKKTDAAHTYFGLGTAARVAAVRSERAWATVVLCNPAFQMLFVSQLSTAHCVCAEVQAPGFSFYVVSHYFQHRDDIEVHLRHLDMVLRTLRGKRVIVALDSNAKSALWGSPVTDERGVQLEDLIRASGMDILNDAGQPATFWTTRGESYIDVTLASPSMSRFVKDWKVRSDWTTSDHRALDVRLQVPKAATGDRVIGPSRFATRRADWERFAEILTALSRDRLEGLVVDSAEDVETMATTLTSVLTDACVESMPRKKRFRKSNPWWTRALTNKRRLVVRQMRAYQRERTQPLRLEKLQVYRTSLREYGKEVKKAKRDSWKDFVTSYGNKEPWGFVYKHQADKLHVEKVLSTIRRGEETTLSMRESARGLLDTHVPDDRVEEDSLWHSVVRQRAREPFDTEDAGVFTEAEMKKACRTFVNGKAPGPDLIEVEVLKRACSVIPDQLLRLYNACLTWGIFPAAWKEGSLRVLLKGEDKDEKDPKSYRPICLLSVVGKLLEKLIKKKLTVVIEEGVSSRQFGFMSGRSTEDAIVELRAMVDESASRYTIALLFDIAGAFDNVWWPMVFRELRARQCPANIYKVLQSYFENRRVTLAWGEESVSKLATKGCPQGSVLGPACWNIMFDSLLRKLEDLCPDRFIAYADDLLVLVCGESREELEIESQRIVDAIVSWSRDARLELSARKTEAILLKTVWVRPALVGRRRPDRQRRAMGRPDLARRYPTIRLGNAIIPFKDSVRYLGVHFDKEMGVNTHCRYLRDKVGSLFTKLGRLAGSGWGLRYKALKEVYSGVFLPIVAYAAAGWADLCNMHDTRVLRSAQHIALKATTAAYRTSSWDSLCVIAGAIPVDILLVERRVKYQIQIGVDAWINNVEIASNARDAIKRIKEQALDMWQAHWDSSTKGRTTYAYFGRVRERLEARWLQTNHHSMQVLTGHGNFRARLASFNLVDGENCRCGLPETSQHFLLECPRFEAQRVALREVIGDREWPEAARQLVSSAEAFAVFSDFCTECLWLKAQEELAELELE